MTTPFFHYILHSTIKVLDIKVLNSKNKITV